MFQNSHVYLCTIMAEGGFDPTNPTTEKNPLIPPGDDDDDDDTNPWDNADLNQMPAQPPDDTDHTNPFESGATSTQSGDENLPMTTGVPPEKQRASGGTAETSFNNTEPVTTHDAFARRELQDSYPRASKIELEFRIGRGGIIEVKYYSSEKWDPLFTKSPGDTQKTSNKSLPKRVQAALGPYTPTQPDAVDEEIAATNKALQDQQTQEAAQLKALHQAQTKAE